MITPQSGSIALPLQLITQCTPREKDLPQLPSTLGAQEMHQAQQELMKRQGNKLERSYMELTPGTPVWVQHRQSATWEPAIVVNQCAENQIYSNSCQTDRTHEGLSDRNQKTRVLSSSYSQYNQRLCL